MEGWQVVYKISLCNVYYLTNSNIATLNHFEKLSKIPKYIKSLIIVFLNMGMWNECRFDYIPIIPYVESDVFKL